MASGEGSARIRVARLIQGDPNPSGPGYKEADDGWVEPKEIALTPQRTDWGSFVEVPDAPHLNPSGAFTLALWLYPTSPATGWRTLAAKWVPGELSYAVFYAGDGFVVGSISQDGTTAHWATAREFVRPGEWHFVALTYEPEAGDLCLYQWWRGRSALRSVPAPKRISPGPVHAGQAPLLFGALAVAGERAMHRAHFNGKIARPALFDAALGAEDVDALVAGAPPQSVGPLLGCWDPSRAVSSARVVDVSGHGRDGRAVNSPGRAVTGPFWRGGDASLYTEAPELYDALHLHDDDLEDARWDTTLEIAVPPDARSGIHAAIVEVGADRLYLPFVVRPRTPRAPLAVLIPTLTWHAYSSNRSPYSFTEDGVLDRGLCVYNVHSDGSPVHYCTRHKPTRVLHPSAGFQHWGAHLTTASLYLVDWLEQKRFEYDALGDEHLHAEGFGALAPYRCVILGSHPEYWTRAMLAGLTAYLADGGRVMYLGGNGLYWVASIDPERPHLIEVRKSGEGDFHPWLEPFPGELQHSTTLEAGGLWARRGFPPRRLLGVEYSSHVFHESGGRWGFERLPTSREESHAWIFEGVDEDVVGRFGLNLGSAAGFEMDSVQEWDPGDASTIALARARHEEFSPTRSVPVPPASDIALTTFRGGGLVFAAGSVTWTGSLAHSDYENSVSRITENVLGRFLGPS